MTMNGVASWLIVLCLAEAAFASFLLYSTPQASYFRRLVSAIAGIILLILGAATAWVITLGLQVPAMPRFVGGTLAIELVILALLTFAIWWLLQRYGLPLGRLIIGLLGWLILGLFATTWIGMLVGAYLSGTSPSRLGFAALLILFAALILTLGKRAVQAFSYMLLHPTESGLPSVRKSDLESQTGRPAGVSFYIVRWWAMIRTVHRVFWVVFCVVFLTTMSTVILFDKGSRDVVEAVGANKW